MQRYKKDFIITLIPFIVGIGIAESLCFISIGKENEMILGLISIAVALIGVAGALLTNYFQFKKDGNRIAEIDKTTSNIEPQIHTIKELSKETNDCIQGSVVYEMQNIMKELYSVSNDLNGDLKNKVDNLVEDLNYRKRISAETSGGFSRDYIVTGIDEVYKENVYLKNLLRDKKEYINELERERNNNLDKIKRLETEKNMLNEQLRLLKKEKETSKNHGREMKL